jgi:redox-sensitive bicupin YhaK (pirin superfamily)
MKQVQRVVRHVRPHWVGDGFPVRSLFSYHEGDEFDPFLLLDYAAPYEFAPSNARRGVGEHPHRGFETVTIVYQGELEHRDSGGHHGSIGPGDVQWMTAAAGVVHEEFHGERFARAGGTFEVAQLWVNLPAEQKLSPPRYQGILARQIPVVPLADGAGSLKLIAGEFRGKRGPAQTFTPVNLWDVELAAGGRAEFSLPDGYTTLLLVRRGNVTVNDAESVDPAELAVFDRAGDRVSLAAAGNAAALLLCGQPLGEPVVGQGPFVMNTPEQIQQAFLDYQAGRLGRLSSG